MTQSKTGRGRPPTNRQFGRGQRRAAGRPRGAIGEKTIVEKIASEMHQVQQNGQTINVNTIELLLLSMRNLAMSGHLQASKWLSEYRQKQLPESGSGVGFLVVSEVMPEEQYVARALFMNKFRTNPEFRDDPLISTLHKN